MYNPAGLHVAEGALKDAETSYDLHGSDYRTRDRSYAVIRKIERVEAFARTRKFEADAEELLHEAWVRKMHLYMEMLQRSRPHADAGAPP